MTRPFACALALLAAPAAAQTFAPAPSVAEGRAPRPPRAAGIPTALAVEAAQAAVATCAASGLKVTALVVDSVGAPITMLSGDGAALITQRIAAGKAMTVIRTGRPSGEAEVRGRADAAFLATLLGDPAVGPPRPGAYPILSDAATVGALAVSGAPTGAQDEPCARAGIAAIAARVPGARTPVPTPPDPTHITLQSLKDLTFEGTPGETRAKLYGDPEKPGPYGIVYKWEPGHHSKPHVHAVDRHGYVISGNWWMSSSDREDLSTLYPVPAGSFVVHKAGQVHWDGGVDGIAYVLVTGIGPIDTRRVSPR